MGRPKLKRDPKCGRRLAGRLTSCGVTQFELSTMIDCGPQHISNIVRGKRRLTPELAQKIVDKALPGTNVEWLLNQSEFETIAEKEAYLEEVSKKRIEAKRLHDRSFRLFVDGLKDLCGYELYSQGSGEHISVNDSTGEKIGVIPQESFQKLQSEVENYASYLIQRIIKAEMTPMPGEGTEGIEKWLTSKSAGIKPEN